MKTLLFLILLIKVSHCCGQSYIQLNEDDQFAYQVKQIDELFERFNGDKKTLLQEYVGKSTSAGLNRTDLLKTIFNATNENWNIGEVKSFIDYVSNSTKPIYINFEDDAWYADATCSVIYNGKKRKVQLVLKVQKENKGGLKWVLVSAKSDFLMNIKPQQEQKISIVTTSTNSLHPLSHATEFMALDYALKDYDNLANYIIPRCTNKELLAFLGEIKNKNIVFDQVDNVVYHFLQIDGWGFEVSKFRRHSKNAGWLVSSLVKMDDEDKKQYLASVLNIK